jgi:hypothetical protein
MFEKASEIVKKAGHNAINAKGTSGWDKICGGAEGTSFEYHNEDYCLVGVKGRAGQYINELQFLFSVHKGEASYQRSPTVGGDGGQQFLFETPAGEWIEKVHIWYGDKVEALQFETNGGKISEKFGGPGGKEHITGTPGKVITGVKGRSAVCIDQICFALS